MRDNDVTDRTPDPAGFKPVPWAPFIKEIADDYGPEAVAELRSFTLLLADLPDDRLDRPFQLCIEIWYPALVARGASHDEALETSCVYWAAIMQESRRLRSLGGSC
jgi:hypothetical protein